MDAKCVLECAHYLLSAQFNNMWYVEKRKSVDFLVHSQLASSIPHVFARAPELITFVSFEMSHRHPNVCATLLVGIVYYTQQKGKVIFILHIWRERRKRNIQIVGTFIETATTHTHTRHQSNLFSAKVPFASRISFWNSTEFELWEKSRACRKVVCRWRKHIRMSIDEIFRIAYDFVFRFLLILLSGVCCLSGPTTHTIFKFESFGVL